jgi:DNA-binding NarL/FixJ family response regulator
MDANRRLSVVLADELGMVRDGLSAICEATLRYRVVAHCADGAEALRAVTAQTPDFAVLDLGLPKMYTLEVVRRLTAERVRTRFVVTASRGDRKTALEALRAGAGAFVLKSGPARHLLDAFEQVLAGGAYVSPVLESFLPGSPESTGDPLDALSAREHQVFTLLVDGARARDIAERLDLSPKTVDTYRASLMRKLDIHDLAGLVKFAIERRQTVGRG